MTWKAALALAGAAATVGLGKFLAFNPNPSAQTKFTLEPPSTYPVGSITHIAEARAWLRRDERGFFAMSGICTHLGCSVKQSPKGFECPCHGSRFAADGAVISGQARRPLRRIFVGLGDDGRLWIDAAREVNTSFHRIFSPSS